MEKEVSQIFESCFAELKDPRIERKKLYPLVEILLVVLCGTICGADSWRDFVLFGKEKLIFSGNIFPSGMAYPQKTRLLDCFMYWILTLSNVALSSG